MYLKALTLNYIGAWSPIPKDRQTNRKYKKYKRSLNSAKDRKKDKARGRFSAKLYIAV